MNIKVCGITSVKQLHQLDGLDIDFAGLVFSKQSPDYVVDRIPVKELAGVDLDIKKVGVFVNSEYDEIMKIAESYDLDIIQLNGDESPYLCEQVSNEIEVIKTFRVGDSSEKSVDYMVADYDEVCDYYLFDVSGKEASAGPKNANWKRIAESKIEKPFFMSGGISPKDGPVVKTFRHPDFYGVDLNRGFDKEAGVKDMALILQFIHSLKLTV